MEKRKPDTTRVEGRKQEGLPLTVSVLRLFPSLRKIQAINGKERTVEGMSAKQET